MGELLVKKADGSVTSVLNGGPSAAESLNIDGSVADEVALTGSWSPTRDEYDFLVPPLAYPSGSPAFPDVMEYDGDGFVVKEAGLYICQMQVYASAYVEVDGIQDSTGDSFGWIAGGACDPWWVSALFSAAGKPSLRKAGNSTVVGLLPLPVGGRVRGGIEKRSNVETLTIPYASLMVTQAVKF